MPSLTFIYLLSHLFTLFWSHGFFYSLDHNSILLLFIILRMLQLFHNGSSILLTCNHFYLSTVFWQYRMLKTHLVFFFPQPISIGSSGSFQQRTVLESKIRMLDVFTTSPLLLSLDFLSRHSQKIYVCLLSIYTYICTPLFIYRYTTDTGL